MTLDLKEIIGNIPKKKLIYILGVLGIFLIFISSFPKGDTAPSVQEMEFDYCREIEERLEKILPDIASVGKVSVMVTAKNFGKITLAKDKSDNGEETIIINKKGGGEDGLVLEEAYPSIQGVIIVAEGGRSDKVKAELSEAAAALLGVDIHRIKVFERKIK